MMSLCLKSIGEFWRESDFVGAGITPNLEIWVYIYFYKVALHWLNLKLALLRAGPIDFNADCVTEKIAFCKTDNIMLF